MRKHYFRYEVGLQRDTKSQPLRMGQWFHYGLERVDLGDDLDDVCDMIRAEYAITPSWADSHEWATECEKVIRLLAAHVWRWSEDRFEVVATEQAFILPLANPDTGASSRTFKVAGKIDRIVKLPDGRLAVQEYKTCGVDITPGSDYWMRLRIDQQISMYMLAARRLGHDVQTVIYDVTRKPATRPHTIPAPDADGVKIVLDADNERVKNANGKWKQSASAADGHRLVTRNESPREYGDRLTADIGDRPEYYFQRQEIPRLDADLAEFESELWQIGQMIRDAQRHGRHFRNTSACLSPYRCEYFTICSESATPDPATGVPAGYAIDTNVHPELEIDDDGNSSTETL